MNGLKKITLIPFSGSEVSTKNILFISKQLAKMLKLTDKNEISVNVGNCYSQVKVRLKEIGETEILCSENLLTKWNLPSQRYSFFVHYNESSKILHFGPIIGVLTEINDDNPHQPNFNSIHSFCEELDHVTQNLGGFFYVFPLQSLNIDDDVKGYYFHEEQWIHAKLPTPDVIYNRIHSRRLESSSVFQQFRNQIQIDSIPMFNHRFLSKWEVYDVLKTEEHLHPYIPLSKLYSKKNLEHMIAQHSILYLKPIHGSLGRKIIRIEQKDNAYHLQFSYFKEKRDNLVIYNISELHELIAPFVRKTTYLIQQGIPFIHFQNRTIDFRVLCHKNTSDTWSVTSVVARLSADKQFVSNIARGGETIRPLRALSLIFDKKTSKQILFFIKELALEFASIISLNSEGLTGELGIDIGVDIEGNPWIIEINSKPSKNSEVQEIKIRPSAKAIISYCHQLALKRTLNKEKN